MPFAHKSLAGCLQLSGYESTVHERVSIQCVPRAPDGNAAARLSGELSLHAYRRPYPGAEASAREHSCLHISHANGADAFHTGTRGSDAMFSTFGLLPSVHTMRPCPTLIHQALWNPPGGRSPTYSYVYPNLMINRYGAWMDTNVVQPTGAATCTVRFDWWLDPRLAGDADTVQQERILPVVTF